MSRSTKQRQAKSRSVKRMQNVTKTKMTETTRRYQHVRAVSSKELLEAAELEELRQGLEAAGLKPQKVRRELEAAKAAGREFNQELEAARQEFEAGNYKVILKYMYICTCNEIMPPIWLAEAFCDRVGRPENFETWDDAFGPPMPRGTKRARREEMRKWVQLALEIRKLRAKGIKGEELYRQAAYVFGSLDWQTVRDAYYRKPKDARDTLEKAASFMESQFRKDGPLDGQSLEEFETCLQAIMVRHFKSVLPPVPSS
jgi:hypothetical protein